MTNPIVHTFDHDDLSTGPLELDDSYLVPFTEDQWTYPVNSVKFAPPPTGPREIAKINPERTAWEVIPDWTGHVYWLADRSRHEIKRAGFEPPAGALDSDPGPSLSDVKTKRIADIVADCEAAIVAGFPSDALGEEFFYPCKLTDQANLQASVSVAREIADIDPAWRAPFWCRDGDGQWSYQLHTSEQIRKVGMDAYAATLAKLQRKGILEAQIAAATSAEGVQAIVWDEQGAVE